MLDKADAIEREIRLPSDRGIIQKATSTWAVRFVKLKIFTVPYGVPDLLRAQQLGEIKGVFQRRQECSWFPSIDLASGFHQLPTTEANSKYPDHGMHLATHGSIYGVGFV